MKNSSIVQQFITEIWNQQAFEKTSQFLHEEFKDHSLPPVLPTNVEGTKAWIINTGQSFQHFTRIEDQVCEGDKCMIKITMQLKHIGTWRDLEATGLEFEAAGYRYFRLKDGKIAEHWALIDGQAIENQILNAAHGCKLAK